MSEGKPLIPSNLHARRSLATKAAHLCVSAKHCSNKKQALSISWRALMTHTGLISVLQAGCGGRPDLCKCRAPDANCNVFACHDTSDKRVARSPGQPNPAQHRTRHPSKLLHGPGERPRHSTAERSCTRATGKPAETT